MNDKSRKSQFQFTFQNSFVYKKIKISENNKDIEDYTAQDHKMLNTMEATAHFCFKGTLKWYYTMPSLLLPAIRLTQASKGQLCSMNIS